MTSPTFRLDGKTALVTGAAGGIGARVAVGLAEFGADVGCIDVSAEHLEKTVQRIQACGRKAMSLEADVTNPGSLDASVEKLESELGALKLAVNCAGIHSTRPSEEMERKVWTGLVDVNLNGVFFSCQAEGRAMLRNGRGSIVNVGSISATIANRGLKQAHYNSTKAAVVQLSRSLALEWADRGVRVNVVSPGYVKTPLAREAQTSRTLAQYVDDIPLGRMAEPVEMVGPTVFLLSDAGSYCTGTELVVDGGATSW
jgi:NAD(P)-dependent dehydrogenase (short-subunit alcohol dehydrogenase family)